VKLATPRPEPRADSIGPGSRAKCPGTGLAEPRQEPTVERREAAGRKALLVGSSSVASAAIAARLGGNPEVLLGAQPPSLREHHCEDARTGGGESRVLVAQEWERAAEGAKGICEVAWPGHHRLLERGG